jgi:hypothetical protein
MHADRGCGPASRQANAAAGAKVMSSESESARTVEIIIES